MAVKEILNKIFGKQAPSEQEIEQQAREWGTSREYRTFLEDAPSEEKGFTRFFIDACKFSSNILKVKAPDSLEKNLNNSLKIIELDVSPSQIFSFTILSILLSLVVILPFLIFVPGTIFFVPLPFVLGYLFLTYPSYLAAVTKIKANDETVKVILYIVIYLRLNPQIEGAFEFASAHATGPIGRDLRKIVWDLRVRKFVTLNEAIGSKVDKWLLWDKEFVEAMNLIQAISLETSEKSREGTLDKTLSYILDSTHEKMKNYARELRTPITLIHTMGITFPIMGLVMFPMVSIFLHNEVNPNYLIVGYIGILPLFNYFYLRRTISKRPGAFSSPDISHHPDLPPEGKFVLKFGDKKYYLNILFVSIVVAVLLMLPGIGYFASLASAYYQSTPEEWKVRVANEYKPDVAPTLMIYSLTTVWGIGIGLAIYFLGVSYQRMKIRDEIKTIEDEFQIGLFRLGDVLSSGIPVESALDETLHKYRQYKLEGSPMFAFFSIVLKNIRDMGMTLKSAIFDQRYGVIKRYPSTLIRDIMQIIVSASEKSSQILSIAARSISSFLMRTKNVEVLLKELLDEISAAIQMQTSFIAPFICGIVAGLATFIIMLLRTIGNMLQKIEEMMNMSGTFVYGSTKSFSDIMGMVNIDEVIPATVFQLVVGIYMVELVIILAYFLNGIKFGFDKVSRNVLIGKSLITALILYSIVTVISVYIASQTSILSSLQIGSLGGG